MFMIEIILKYNRVHFEELYDKDPSFSYWKNDFAMGFYTFLFASFILTFLLTISEYHIGFLIISIGISIYYLIRAIIKAIKIRKEKIAISDYLSNLDQVEKFKLQLGHEHLKLFADSELSEYQWSAFSKFDIYDDCVILYKLNQQSLIFPAKSMEPHEYENLLDILSEKISRR